jgi:hypothetical protein
VAGDETVRGVAILVLAITLREHVFFLRFQHRELADFSEVASKAGFRRKDRQSNSTGHGLSPPIVQAPDSGEPGRPLLDKSQGRCDVPRRSFPCPTHMQHTPDRPENGRSVVRHVAVIAG